MVLIRRFAAAFALVCAAPAAAQSGGVVVSASPEATAAGVEILEAGGNAVDAAVAVAFALGVTDPAAAGLGADTRLLIVAPGGAPTLIDGTGAAPADAPDAATPDGVSVGRTAATVPAAARALDAALDGYGSGAITWARAIAPAIRIAEDGVRVGPYHARVYLRHEADLQADIAATNLFLDADGRALREGDMTRRPVLAATLRRLAAVGADDVYAGDIAGEIAADMAANGGWITADDLAAASAHAGAALDGVYGGYDVLAAPSDGATTLDLLAALAQAPRGALDADDDDRAFALARALLRAGPTEMDGAGWSAFVVVDADGLAVAATTSLGAPFGARRASPTLGFLYNARMQGGPAPGPVIVARDGAAVLALGGSSDVAAQAASHWIDAGADVQAAVAAPLVRAPLEDGVAVSFEASKTSSALLARLGAAGVGLVAPRGDLRVRGRNADFGGVSAAADEAFGWTGAADPRRDGTTGYADLRRFGDAE